MALTKLNDYPAEYDQWFSMMPRRLDLPYHSDHLKFLITNQCNLKCKYCYSYFNKQKEKSDPDLLKAYLDDYIEYQTNLGIIGSAKQITFTGGEASLHTDCITTILQHLDQSPLKYIPIIMTNGVISHPVLDILIDHKLSFQISFDGIDGKHRVNAAGNCFEAQITSTIDRINAANLPVSITCTIMQDNVHKLKEIVQFAVKHHITKVFFIPLTIHGNAIFHQSVLKRAPIEIYKACYEEACVEADENDIKIYTVEHSRIQNHFSAKQNEEIVEINPPVLLPDGSLSISPLFTSSQAHNASSQIFGKYDKKLGLLLDYDRIAKLARNFIRNREELCGDCDCYPYCLGRNKNFTALMTDDDISMIDHYVCDIARVNYRTVLKRIKTAQ